MATNQVAAMNGVRNSYRITGRFGVETSWFAWASAGTRPAPQAGHDAAGTSNLYTARLIGRNRPMRILR